MTYGSTKANVHGYWVSTYRDSRFPGYTSADLNLVTQLPSNLIYNVKDGTSNPAFEKQIAAGSDATTNYLKTSYKVKPASVSSKVVGKTVSGGTYYQTGTANVLTHTGGSFPTTDAVIRDIALKKFKSKLQSLVGNINAIVPLAELKDLRHTVKTIAKYTQRPLNSVEFLTRKENLVRRIERIKHGQWDRKKAYGIKDLQNELGELWLNWSFGVKPMLKEAEEIALAVAKRIQYPPYTRISALNKSQILSSQNRQGLSLHTLCFMDAKIETRTDIEYSFVGGFKPEINTSNSYGALSHFGFEAKNIVPTLYELIPFSWLFDYFSTAGDYFNDTFEVPPGMLVYLNEVKKVRMEQKETYVPVFPKDDSWTTYTEKSFLSTPGGMKYFSYQRTKLTSLPTRIIRIKTSDEIGKNATTKLLNLVAVLASRGNILSLFKHL